MEKLVSQNILKIRSETFQAIRTFFIHRGFIEVDTPVRIKCPAMELNIDAEQSGNYFLRTSPELEMKCLISSGCEKIFQICPCFRKGELGKIHNPEFTMLEWYRKGTDYKDILSETKELIIFILKQVLKSTNILYQDQVITIETEWEYLTIQDAFYNFAGWDPIKEFDSNRFDFDISEKVIPELSPYKPTVLIDYPMQMAALAQCKDNNPSIAERWELYIAGMEIANAFSELTNAEEQRQRFIKCAEMRKSIGKDIYPLNETFLSALKNGMPTCGGVALGVDRLIMLITNSPEINNVRIHD